MSTSSLYRQIVRREKVSSILKSNRNQYRDSGKRDSGKRNATKINTPTTVHRFKDIVKGKQPLIKILFIATGNHYHAYPPNILSSWGISFFTIFFEEKY